VRFLAIKGIRVDWEVPGLSDTMPTSGRGTEGTSYLSGAASFWVEEVCSLFFPKKKLHEKQKSPHHRSASVQVA